MTSTSSSSSDSSPDYSPMTDRGCTQEWLESILEGYFTIKFPNMIRKLRVLQWHIKPVEGEGYLSEMLSLDVLYVIAGEHQRAQLVAKLLPPDPYKRAFVIQTQFDLREIKFYTEIAPALLDVIRRRVGKDELQRLPIPECFHTVYKEDSESILVMEDLRRRGYFHQNLNKGLTIRQAEAAVNCLAQIHSASIALQTECNQDLATKFPYLLTTEKAEEAFHTLFEKGLPLLLKFLQNKPELAFVSSCLQDYAGNRSKDVFQRVLSPSDKINTLVHCDFWSNNLMLRTLGNETSCQIIDWQMIMQGKPSVDVGMLITTSLTAQTRRNHEEEIINTYWSSLLRHLRQLEVKDKDFNYTYDDFITDLKDGKLFGVLVTIGSVDIALGDPEREDRVLSLIKDLMKEGIL